MFELKNVSKFYNSNGTVSLGLKNINLTLNKGEFVAICGESGAGKSTLLNVITKMDTFDEGEIYFKGNETSYFDVSDMDVFRKDKIGFIFQSYNIIESFTVLKNVMLPLEILGYSREEARDKATQIISKVGLSHRINNRGSELSGGEKQRCVIARALVTDCEILACDEPTGNLDSKTGAEIIKLIKEVASDKLVLIVTHNFDEIKEVATRKITVKDGSIIEDLNLKEVNDDNLVEDLVLNHKNIKKRTIFNLAKDNLVYTPKKTFFMTLILLLVSFAILTSIVFLIQTVNDSELKSPFIPQYDNINLVTNNSTDGLDLSGLEDRYKVYYEPFEAFDKTKLYKSDSFNNYFLDNAVYCDPYNLYYYVPNYGSYPSSEDEVLIMLPYSQDTKAKALFDVNTNIGKKIYLGSNTKNLCVRVSGIVLTKDVVDGAVLCGNETVKNFLHYQRIRGIIDYSYTFGSGTYKTNISLTTYISDTNKIVLPKTYADNPDFSINKIVLAYNTSVYIYNLSLSQFEIEYTSDESVLKSGIYVNDIVLDDHYEALIYGNSNKVLKDVSMLGYSNFVLSTYQTENAILENLNIYLTIGGAVLVFVVVYFITYLILKASYKSKEKDYNILRTLGITKKSMNGIVRTEILTITLICSFFVYALSSILGNLINVKFFKYYRGLPFVVFIVYIVLILLLSLNISMRFNKKLFNTSVNSVFKDKEK